MSLGNGKRQTKISPSWFLKVNSSSYWGASALAQGHTYGCTLSGCHSTSGSPGKFELQSLECGNLFGTGKTPCFQPGGESQHQAQRCHGHTCARKHAPGSGVNQRVHVKCGLKCQTQLFLCSCSIVSNCFVTPWTVARQAPLSKVFLRQEYWIKLPFSSPGDFSNSGIKPTSPAWLCQTQYRLFNRLCEVLDTVTCDYLEAVYLGNKSIPFLFSFSLIFPQFVIIFLSFSVFFSPSASPILGFPGGSAIKSPPANAGDLGSIPGLGRSPLGGNGNPLQYSCLENPPGQRSLAGYNLQGYKRVRHDFETKQQVLF